MAYSLTPAQFIEQYPFTSVDEARKAAGAKFHRTVGAFGARQYGVSRYQLRKYDEETLRVTRPLKSAKQACDSRKTSAKAICVKLYRKHADDRAAFLAAAAARAIKPLTANTLWNDIKAGRVA